MNKISAYDNCFNFITGWQFFSYSSSVFFDNWSNKSICFSQDGKDHKVIPLTLQIPNSSLLKHSRLK